MTLSGREITPNRIVSSLEGCENGIDFATFGLHGKTLRDEYLNLVAGYYWYDAIMVAVSRGRKALGASGVSVVLLFLKEFLLVMRSEFNLLSFRVFYNEKLAGKLRLPHHAWLAYIRGYRFRAHAFNSIDGMY